MSDADEIVRLVIERVQAQIDAQLAADDAVDLKALGVLAAIAAAIGVLVASHSSLNPYWWAPMVMLSSASLVLLYVVYPVDLQTGPRWTDWYVSSSVSIARRSGRYNEHDGRQACSSSAEAGSGSAALALECPSGGNREGHRRWRQDDATLTLAHFRRYSRLRC